MEWTIADVARLSGTTSRTLRHYGAVGLLAPSRVAHGGLRYYDQQALVRLQRILLLRQLGLGLSAIGEVLDGQRDTAVALRGHLMALEEEKSRIERLIGSVRTTLRKTEGGEQLMAEEVFDGFDHTQYREEVTRRWGREAYERGDRWWRNLTDEGKRELQGRHEAIAADYGLAREQGLAPDSEQVQRIAARHVEWLGASVEVSKQYVANIGAMYVDDERFGRNYDKYGAGTAELVRDALVIYSNTAM